MTATLAELLAELEDSPAETDPLTVEAVLVRAGYNTWAVSADVRGFAHARGTCEVYLRFDRRYVPPERVVEIVAHIRMACGVPRRTR